MLVFDRQGNAKVFTLWNERQDWLHVSYFCISITETITNSVVAKSPKY